MLTILKEAARVLLLALISWLLTEGVLSWVFQQVGLGLTPDVKATIITFTTVILKGVDRKLHEAGKESGSDVMTKGLVRF